MVKDRLFEILALYKSIVWNNRDQGALQIWHKSKCALLPFQINLSVRILIKKAVPSNQAVIHYHLENFN